ncbi:hypothetical protein LIER_00562 [Lithospermum erythrorhizon]|uniref:Retrovirus-related Pol polyprotein from transposon TNT 1-94-like beta-barrel domain-containing protein n=1 Tax=Lithospermum erythrorhizon TaxID=34254 RepID=A0AAV3NHU2_LITER
MAKNKLAFIVPSIAKQLRKCGSSYRIVMMRPFSRISDVLLILLQEEKQRDFSHPTPISTVASAFYSNRNTYVRGGRGAYNHPNRGRGAFNNVGRGRDEQFNKLVTLLNTLNISRPSSARADTHTLMACKPSYFAIHKVFDRWILDSGVSDHITPHLHLFTSYKVVPLPRYITIPNSTQVHILHFGTVQLSPHLLLHNVLHIPSFQYHLLSIKKLCADMSVNVLFTSSSCILQGHSLNKHLVFSEASKGLYILDTQYLSDCYVLDSFSGSSILPYVNDSPVDVKNHCDVRTVHNMNKVTSISSCSTTGYVSFHSAQHLSYQDSLLWHSRVGHLPLDTIAKISTILSPALKSLSFICQIYPKAKQCRQSFPHNIPHTTAPFELIHIDTWGPYKHSG